MTPSADTPATAPAAGPPPAPARPGDARRADFAAFEAIPTRWDDEDVYGHVNNVQYYAFFDTAVNGWLMRATGTDIRRLHAIGVVAETSCRFLRELSFPGTVHAGIAVERLGARSVVYRLGLFRDDDEGPSAVGRFVHVYVDRDSRAPVPVPDAVRAAVEGLARRAGPGAPGT